MFKSWFRTLSSFKGLRLLKTTSKVAKALIIQILSTEAPKVRQANAMEPSHPVIPVMLH
jgi:hypothetical protein